MTGLQNKRLHHENYAVQLALMLAQMRYGVKLGQLQAQQELAQEGDKV